MPKRLLTDMSRTACGVSSNRLQKFIVAAGEHAGNQDEIFWWHTDKLLIDQLGLPFEREKEG